jgi:hypothetical protein
VAGAEGGAETAVTAGTARVHDTALDPPLRRRGRLAAAGAIVLLAASALVAGSWLVAAVAHLDDGHAVDHVAGTWMALARYATEGTLYPPLYDGEAFGGTRFMPLPIALQAGAAELSGEYLVSAKALSYALAATLVALVFVLLRRRCPLPVAALLASTLLVTGTGLSAALSVRNDALPVTLQLVAVALVARSATRRVVIVAGALCAIAVVAKLSAVWGALAIGIWLLARDRRALVRFSTAFVATLAGLLVVFQLLSDGRMAENVFGLSLSTGGRHGSLDDELARVRLVAEEGLGLLVVLPALALVGTLLAARERRVTLFHVAFLCASLVTAVVLVDPGAFVNHLLDVQVLSILVVGELWRRTAAPSGASSLASVALAAVLLVGIAAEYRGNVSVGSDVDALLHGADPEDRVPRLGDAVGSEQRILSEDPFVPVSHDLRPVVLDAFMLVSVARRHPEWRRDLVRRIEAAEFDTVVLLHQPESAPLWYRNRHFGEEIVGAITRTYRPVERVDGYWIYVPA